MAPIDRLIKTLSADLSLHKYVEEFKPSLQSVTAFQVSGETRRARFERRPANTTGARYKLLMKTPKRRLLLAMLVADSGNPL